MPSRIKSTRFGIMSCGLYIAGMLLCGLIGVGSMGESIYNKDLITIVLAVAIVVLLIIGFSGKVAESREDTGESTAYSSSSSTYTSSVYDREDRNYSDVSYNEDRGHSTTRIDPVGIVLGAVGDLLSDAIFGSKRDEEDDD